MTPRASLHRSIKHPLKFFVAGDKKGPDNVVRAFKENQSSLFSPFSSTRSRALGSSLRFPSQVAHSNGLIRMVRSMLRSFSLVFILCVHILAPFQSLVVLVGSMDVVETDGGVYDGILPVLTAIIVDYAESMKGCQHSVNEHGETLERTFSFFH